MAEDVQATLDGMVPALKQLEERGVFTKEEIHQIVDRRRNSEYEIRRIKDPRKADFLRYIEAEINLEQLRKIRTRRIKYKELQEIKANGKDRKDKVNDAGDTVETKLGDLHVGQHIHSLWWRTLRKFGKSDVSLYLQYAAYCKETKADKSLSRALAQAVQLFPHEEGLWIEAASHDFFTLGNIQSARVLLQQGIRLQEKSQDLWLQLFILELHFVERLKARRAILGGEDSKVEETEEEKMNDKDSEVNREVGETEEEKMKDNDNEANDPHKIARIVYQNAIKAIPDVVAFRLKFWDQCRLFSDTQNLQKYIVDSIRNDLCKNDPDAWMAWALFQWERKSANDKLKARGNRDDNKSEGEESSSDESSDENPAEGKKRKNTSSDEGDTKGTSQKKPRIVENEQEGDPSVLDVLQQATKAIPTEEMYLKATRMISRYIATLQEEEQEEDDEEDPEIPAGLRILETLFEEAEKSDFFSEELVTEQALFLSRCGRKEDSAECLRRFAEKKPTENALKIWINLAELSQDGPIPVLSKALGRTNINHPTYYELLLHLFGAKLQAQDDTDLMSLFEKISLLTPGLLPINPIEEPIFGVSHALDASLQFLRYLKEKREAVSARKVYRTVTSQSSLGSIFVDFDDGGMDSFVEEAACVEMGDQSVNKSARQKNLVRLYSEAAKLFGNSELSRKYQERKREAQLGNGRFMQEKERTELSRREDGSCFIVDARGENAEEDFLHVFQTYQVAHLKHARINAQEETKKPDHHRFDWKSISGLFENLNDQDKKTWCIETPGGEGSQEISPRVFLEAATDDTEAAAGAPAARGYCSFLVQHDTEAVKHVLANVPLTEPLPGIRWHYPTKAVWFFFGRNHPHHNKADLEGRPEHTDSISTDGTWHYQISGTKTWFLRPSPQLLEIFKHKSTRNVVTGGQWNETSRVRVDCEEGDVLCVNTRLWFHSTIIPAQTVPSVSYARDFFNLQEQPQHGTDETAAEEEGEGMNMSNVDGLYATNDISKGTILFTEKEMPDCELHRSSTDPNCEVVGLEDGTSALMSKRAIRAGEFFCVAESEDEEQEGDNEDDEPEE